MLLCRLETCIRTRVTGCSHPLSAQYDEKHHVDKTIFLAEPSEHVEQAHTTVNDLSTARVIGVHYYQQPVRLLTSECIRYTSIPSQTAFFTQRRKRVRILWSRNLRENTTTIREGNRGEGDESNYLYKQSAQYDVIIFTHRCNKSNL